MLTRPFINVVFIAISMSALIHPVGECQECDREACPIGRIANHSLSFLDSQRRWLLSPIHIKMYNRQAKPRQTGFRQHLSVNPLIDNATLSIMTHIR